jgi:uncharacterized protein YndB with AHSA1/START domain
LTAVVQRVLPAPPDVVFEEWIDPDALAEWMCPRPARATNIDLEPAVGGSLRIDIEEAGVEFYVTGRYLELQRPQRLRLTWSCSTWPRSAVDEHRHRLSRTSRRRRHPHDHPAHVAARGHR